MFRDPSSLRGLWRTRSRQLADQLIPGEALSAADLVRRGQRTLGWSADEVRMVLAAAEGDTLYEKDGTWRKLRQ